MNPIDVENLYETNKGSNVHIIRISEEEQERGLKEYSKN